MKNVSKFVTDSGQFYDPIITSGATRATSSRFMNAEAAIGCRRAKVVAIDILIHVKGEFGLWVLWQGDEDQSSTTYNTPDAVRTSTSAVAPLQGGIVPDDQLLKYTLRPANLWQNTDQKLVLAVDPTLGIGAMAFSIHVLYMLGD